MAHSIEELRPQLILNINDEELGLLGYLVIDRTINGVASGGIRMTSDVTLDEVANLAREMTLKYGFLNIPCGGAKAGIIASSSLSIEKRRRILLSFGKSLSPLIMNGIYRPGTDMGTFPEDIYYIFKGAGKKVNSKAFQDAESGYYSALTTFTTAERLIEHLGLSLPNCSVAIEGLGKLGINIAKLFSDSGARIVAISTIEGAILNPEGLNISELVRLKNQFRDKVVENYHDANKIDKAELLTLSVDVLIPCAGSYTLNAQNIPNLKAKIIVPGANIAADSEAEHLMFINGVHYVPGFISNCGEILRYFLSAQGFNEKHLHNIIKERFGKKITNLIEVSQRDGTSIAQGASKIINERLKNMEIKQAAKFRAHSLLLKIIVKLSGLKLRPFKIILMLRWLMRHLTVYSVEETLPQNYPKDSSRA